MLFKLHRPRREVVLRKPTLPAIRIRVAQRLVSALLDMHGKREAELKARLKSDKCEDFSEIYARFRKPVIKYIFARVSDPSVAEEIVQEVFLKIYQFRESYDPSQRLEPWIWTIARNTLFDHLRKTRNDRPGDEALTYDEIPCSSANAEERLLDHHRKEELLEIMSRLPETQRKALLLATVGKLSYHQISKSMNLSLSAVKSLINRGRRSIKKTLEQDLAAESLY